MYIIVVNQVRLMSIIRVTNISATEIVELSFTIMKQVLSEM